MKKTYQMKTNLHEVIAELGNVSEKLISEQADKYNDEQNLIAAIDAINFEVDQDISLDKYCSKTGQKIGSYSLVEYAMMQKIQSPEKIKFYLENKSVEHVAPHWVYTDGNSLKLLSQHDPYGYTVYSLCNIFAFYQKFLKYEKPGQRNSALNKAKRCVAHLPTSETGGVIVTYETVGKRQWLEHKIQAFASISNYPIETILRFNEIARRYLSLLSSSKAHNIIKWSTTDIRTNTKDVDNFNRLINEIRKNIERVVKHELRHKRIKQQVSYSDITSIKDLYHGHANYRRQAKPREMTETELIIDLIKEYLPKSPRDQQPMNFYAYQERIKPKHKPVEHKGELKIKFKPKQQTVNLANIWGKK